MNPRTTIGPDRTAGFRASLSAPNADFARKYPGESVRRQPVHTVYGGAQVFQSDSAPRLGVLALRFLEEFAPTPDALAGVLGIAPSLAP
ncbi:MAG: hypothetical protein M3R62_02775, partial [Acidobacteriota bacterium]|nr:hypothetical protein [Acidobacteriota bacterium]